MKKKGAEPLKPLLQRNNSGAQSMSTQRKQTYKPNYGLRKFLQGIARGLFRILSRFEVEGEENFPKSGPLIVVGNHFSFLDPPAFIAVTPWPMEFIGGAVTPHAPKVVRWIPKMWGYLPVYRGTGASAAWSSTAHGKSRGADTPNWFVQFSQAVPIRPQVETRNRESKDRKTFRTIRNFRQPF